MHGSPPASESQKGMVDLSMDRVDTPGIPVIGTGATSRERQIVYVRTDVVSSFSRGVDPFEELGVTAARILEVPRTNQDLGVHPVDTMVLQWSY